MKKRFCLMNVFVVLLVLPMQTQNIGEVISKQLGIGNPDIISEARMNLKQSEI